jgi:hypothetical protein
MFPFDSGPDFDYIPLAMNPSSIVDFRSTIAADWQEREQWQFATRPSPSAKLFIGAWSLVIEWSLVLGHWPFPP